MQLINPKEKMFVAICWLILMMKKKWHDKSNIKEKLVFEFSFNESILTP